MDMELYVPAHVNTSLLPRASRAPMRPDERLSTRIKASMIVSRLQRFVDGEIEMSAAQVNAARILLNKVLPDLKSLEVNLEPQNMRDIKSIPTSELLAIVEGKAQRLDTSQTEAVPVSSGSES